MRGRIRELLTTTPSVVWLVTFFLVPTLLVFIISFRPPTLYGGIGEGWTLKTWETLIEPSYPMVLWRTIYLSALTTAISIAASIPIAYWLARLSTKARSWMLLLIILPFWTNFLIRIFAWRSLLHSEGILVRFLSSIGILEPGTQLLYNQGAVLLVLVYTYLPFAILPLYAAAEKFDFNLLDAARDLGATKVRSFFSIFLPGIGRGLTTAFIVVFIPALGSYAIPDIVGGPQSEMIGNKIAMKVFVDRNLPHASALASLLALAILLPVIYGILTQQKRNSGGAR